MTDYAKLTNEEINRAVAERVMGWAWLSDGCTNGLKDINGWRINPWCPAADHNDTALMRAEVEWRRLQNRFLYHLRWTVLRNHAATEWQVLNASPRQQCEAALAAAEDVT